MSEILLHNYPASPVAEKVRTALGLKGLSWRSVEIPRLPPKPKLTPLTGGYRRTPVLQIGADIFCDSQCIIRELDRRHPEPSLYPEGSFGLARALSRWTDGAFFDLAVKIVLGAAGDALPRDFAEDRGRLYLGPDWAAGLAAANAELPHLAAQARTHCGWIDEMLARTGAFLTGSAPGMADAAVYHVIWFLRGRWPDGPSLLAEFPALEAWEARIQSFGHGESTPLDADAALRIAAESEPTVPEAGDPNDPQGLTPGLRVSVNPDLDGGEQPTEGILRFADRETVAVLREEPDIGRVAVHFPRAGYKVIRL